MTALVPVLRAEWRRVASTRLWWGLLIPVAALALLVNLFGGLLGDELGGCGFPVLPASVAFTLTLTVVFAAVYGAVAAAGAVHPCSRARRVPRTEASPAPGPSSASPSAARS